METMCKRHGGHQDQVLRRRLPSAPRNRNENNADALVTHRCAMCYLICHHGTRRWHLDGEDAASAEVLRS